MTTEETIEATIVSQCGECETEIKRKKKIYSLKDFNYMSQLHPNSYFKDSQGDYFIMIMTICEECQT